MFTKYDDIPANYRRIILQESGYKRIKNVHIDLCNEIIKDHLQYEKDMEELLNFELTVIKNGKSNVEIFKTVKEAYVALDRALDYDIRTKGVTAVIKQADRIVKALVNGRVYEGKPRGAMEVKPLCRV